jgi:hypothetical protein
MGNRLVWARMCPLTKPPCRAVLCCAVLCCVQTNPHRCMASSPSRESLKAARGSLPQIYLAGFSTVVYTLLSGRQHSAAAAHCAGSERVSHKAVPLVEEPRPACARLCELVRVPHPCVAVWLPACLSLLPGHTCHPVSGEAHPDPDKNPYNTMIMVTDAGEVNLVYRRVSSSHS